MRAATLRSLDDSQKAPPGAFERQGNSAAAAASTRITLTAALMIHSFTAADLSVAVAVVCYANSVQHCGGRGETVHLLAAPNCL